MTSNPSQADSPLAFDEWCILEIMGHQRYAGRVTEHTIAGASFLRIDIPAVEDQASFTKLFSASSVYAITPTTQELATALASKLKNTPISVYDLPEAMRAKLQSVKPRPIYIEDDDDHPDDCYDGDDGEPF